LFSGNKITGYTPIYELLLPLYNGLSGPKDGQMNNYHQFLTLC